MAGLFFEDFRVGDEFVTPRRTVTEADVAQFAGLSGDYNPLHTDAIYAAETPFGARIAHGLLCLSIVTGLTARLGIHDGTTLALLAIEDWRFLKPVRLGDTIHARVTIAATRETSKPDRGIVTRTFQVVNQHGEVVQEGTIPLLVRRRGESDGGA